MDARFRGHDGVGVGYRAVVTPACLRRRLREDQRNVAKNPAIRSRAWPIFSSELA
jgi:hypothetical protein